MAPQADVVHRMAPQADVVHRTAPQADVVRRCVPLMVLRVVGVRQDTDLIVAPDTAAQSAQVSGVKYIHVNEVSGRGHRFTVPDGPIVGMRSPIWVSGRPRDQIASSSTVSSRSASAGAGESEVAASSFFMIEKMKAAETRQMTTRIPQSIAVEILPQRSIGIDTR